VAATTSIPGSGASAGITPVGFGKSALEGETSVRPTSLQFGPDDRLYVAQLDGAILAYSVERVTTNRYRVVAIEAIRKVANIPNHDDDGTPNPAVEGRFVLGILVVGTAAHPVIYASSTDPRFPAVDPGIDTNGGTLSKLRWTGTSWRHRILVRGLPRSLEVHGTNGLQLDASTNTLYVAQGGHTNMGAPSAEFMHLPEYALSGAILSIDLDGLGAGTYDLPTLNDHTRPGNPDANDPFGGNDGRNQARIVPSGPVQVFSPGYRNPYDLVLTNAGRLYATDNGPNAGAGGVPVGEGPGGTCTNDPNEPGLTHPDSLHLVTGPGDYGGAPNPTRGNSSNTFGGQSPVPASNPIECDFLDPGPDRGSLTTFPGSSNGIEEYTADNFDGAMVGDLLVAALIDNLIYRIELDPDGEAVVSSTPLVSNVGKRPLDVTTQTTGEIFPGTIWVADNANSNIYAFEPNDYSGDPGPCTGADDPGLDEDLDNYDNADEIDNGTDPCSAGDVPPDWDGDRTSDLNDPDDDDDGSPDTSDSFAIDPDDGATTELPVRLTWDPGAPEHGGLLDSGFTGLMTNGIDNYRTLFDPAAMTVGAATGTLSIDAATEGTAHGGSNDQEYGFQYGLHVDPSTTGKFRVQARVVAPFAGIAPEPKQAFGIAIGTGGQDDYVELSVGAGDGSGEVEVRKEVVGSAALRRDDPVALPAPDAVDLYLTVDPAAGTVQPRYAVTTGGVTEPGVNLGTPISIPASWFAEDRLAIGIVSTSDGPGGPFPATWDFLKATPLP